MPVQRTSATTQFFAQSIDSLPGFVVRPQQRELALQIEKLLTKVEEGALGPVLVAEAPTGVGKTLAYLVGALAAARAQGRKLLISTCTVNLQAQILDKDIPLFCKAANQALHVALAKGRERYVCPLHLEFTPAAASGDIFDESDNVTYLHQGRQDPIRAQLTASLASGQWDGDRETWPHVLPDSLWNQLRIWPQITSRNQVMVGVAR